MIKNTYKGLVLAGAMLMVGGQSFAGNEDRAGSAGATEVNINPWARSSGWGDAGVSSITGVEAMFLNVAGLAYTRGTEINFTRTNWLGQASQIGLNSFGFAQKLGDAGSLGLSLTSFNYGDLQVTTTELPEGGIGFFSPQSINIGLAYAKQFSKSISGGLSIKVLSSSISNVKAQGVALDAGIRYVTGENDQFKFAISLRNVGAPMRYRGDGLSLSMENISTELTLTAEQRASSFELPSQLHIGTSYDFIFNENALLTGALSYTSNSFTRDQWRIGAQFKYSMKGYNFLLRGGYVYESDIFSQDNIATALTGPTGGISAEIPVSESGSIIGIDYGIRTSQLGLIHSIGARIDLNRE